MFVAEGLTSYRCSNDREWIANTKDTSCCRFWFVRPRTKCLSFSTAVRYEFLLSRKAFLYPPGLFKTRKLTITCSVTPEHSLHQVESQDGSVEEVIKKLESFRFDEQPSSTFKTQQRKNWTRSSFEDTSTTTVLPTPGISHVGWYNKRIRTAAFKRDLKTVMALVLEMQGNQATRPNTVTFAVALSCCAKLRAVEDAQKLWKMYIEERLPVDNHVFCSMIAVYARTVPPNFEAAWEVFQKLKATIKPNKVVYNAMIDICSRTGRFEEALKLFSELKSEAAETPDEYTYNAVLKAYARIGNVEGAIQISREMNSKGIATGAITYSVLIDSLGKCGKLEEAFAFFEEMRQNGIETNVITYNVLLSACAASNNYERALQIVEWMEQRRIVFDRYTYNGLLQSAVNCKQYEAALMWYEKMVRSQITPNNVTFRYLVETAGGLKRFELVLLARQHMQQIRLKGNVYTYAALVASALSCRKMEAAQTFVNDFQHTHRKDNKFYKIVAEILERLGEYEIAEKVILRMREHNGTLDRVSETNK
eukprot:jgi/Galph1/3555/GphlegSOOS_G2184.1